MRILSIWILLAVVGASGLHAQTKSEVMYENEHVRVLKTTLEPHQTTWLKELKRDRVLIHLGSGRMTWTSPDGKVEKMEFKDGEVRWAPARGPHAKENVGDQPFQIVEIELTGKTQPPVTLTDLDPAKVDPKHYKLALENDHVRAVRVSFGPLEKGVVHTHMRNYVVVYMTPQAKGNRGDINPHMNEGTVTHTESNPLDRAVERIAVELK